MIKWLYHKYVVWKVKRQIHRGLVRYFNEPIPEIRWEKLVEDNKKGLETLLNSGILPTYTVEVEPVTEQEKAQGIVKFKILHPGWRSYEID